MLFGASGTASAEGIVVDSVPPLVIPPDVHRAIVDGVLDDARSGEREGARERRRTWARENASLAASGRSTTTAVTASPHFSCGVPMIATSAIDGWRYSTDSTSAG